MSTDFDSVDYFTDPALVPDPHPYFDHLRTKNPVCCPINNGVLAVTVTGWDDRADAPSSTMMFPVTR